MKHNKLSLFSTTALAVGACLLLAPNARAADTKTKLNSADTRFIEEEAAAGAALVKVGKLGVSKAERADIKTFAGMIVTDHSMGNAELAALAGNKGVELTTEVDSKHADTYAKLESASSPNFDQEFLAVMISGHKKCVKNFEDAAENAEDTEVKMWAAKMLPALQAHLDKAEALRSAPTVKAGSASSDGVAANEPDNTARNIRDRDAQTLTPLDQGTSQTDVNTTAEIRKGILSVEDISVNAQNVKIITKQGRVTLRGPVNTEEEKTTIGEIANRIATNERADNQLEVKRAGAAN